MNTGPYTPLLKIAIRQLWTSNALRLPLLATTEKRRAVIYHNVEMALFRANAQKFCGTDCLKKARNRFKRPSPARYGAPGQTVDDRRQVQALFSRSSSQMQSRLKEDPPLGSSHQHPDRDINRRIAAEPQSVSTLCKYFDATACLLRLNQDDLLLYCRHPSYRVTQRRDRSHRMNRCGVVRSALLRPTRAPFYLRRLEAYQSSIHRSCRLGFLVHALFLSLLFHAGVTIRSYERLLCSLKYPKMSQ